MGPRGYDVMGGICRGIGVALGALMRAPKGHTTDRLSHMRVCPI